MPMSGTLDISTSAADGYVAIIVKDTGVGIEADDVPRIFEAYFSRKSTGMGLGLAITKRIVDDHGGRIDVESGPGAGTTVRVYLPIDGPGSTSAG
jgi:signal transduction histidine kinase